MALNTPVSGTLFGSTTSSTATSASFTPAANSLVALFVSVSRGASTEDSSVASVTSTTGLTFTKGAECAWNGSAAANTPAGGAAQSYSGASIWTAPAGAAPAAGTITVTLTQASPAATEMQCEAVWFTDSSGSVPLPGTAGTATSGNGLPSASLALAAGSYMLATRADIFTRGNGTLGTSPAQTAIFNATDVNVSYAAWRTAAPVAAAGSTTLNMTAPASQYFNMAALEVAVPAAGGAVSVTTVTAGATLSATATLGASSGPAATTVTAGASLSATATLTSGPVVTVPAGTTAPPPASGTPAPQPPRSSVGTLAVLPKPIIWTFSVGPHTALPNWALTQARARRVTWRLTTPSDATFSIDGESADALQLSELVTDLWVYRDGSPLFRGRVGTTSDSYDGNLLTTTANVADYKGILARRLLLEGDTLTYANVDQAGIALGLINSTQGHSGGQLGIVAGVGASTGVLRARTYQAGLNVGETLDKLSNVQNGFEWDITPTATAALHLDVFSPTRGANNGVVLDVGGRVRTFQRQFDPGLYANAVRVTGANTTGGTAAGALTAVNQAASNIGSAAQGRWDSQIGDTTIVEQTTLTERAAAELVESQVILPQWTVELQPNGWGGPSDVWLGDTVQLIGKIGRLNDVGPLRVQEVECSFDDDDTVTTKITLGQVPLSRRFRLRTFSQRLTALERR